MGSAGSLMASEDIAHLQHSSHCKLPPHPAIIPKSLVSLAELEALYRRFEMLDRDRSGTLSVEKVLGIPEFAMNPLAPRIIEMLGLAEQELDFTRFIHLLSVFHQRAPRMDKLCCKPLARLPFLTSPRQWPLGCTICQVMDSSSARN